MDSIEIEGTRYGVDFVSPNFGPDKLRSATIEDKIDVFEDRLFNWIIVPAERLVQNNRHSELAALMIAFAVIETLERYRCGSTGTSKAKTYFNNGLFQVIDKTLDDSMKDMIADEIWEFARLGFAHYGSPKGKFIFRQEPGPVSNRSFDVIVIGENI